jgi:hypothetical protein
MKSNQVLMNEVTALLATRVGDWFGADAVLDSASAELRKYPNSFMLRYRVRIGNDQTIVLVKIPRKPAHQAIAEALQNEYLRAHTREYYDFMLATWRTFENAQDSHCFAIRPLEYFEAWNAIAMLEAQGRSLKNMLVIGRPPQTPQFQEHLERAARWIRIFHERLGDLSLETVSRTQIEEELDSILADLAKYSNGQVDTASIRTSMLAAVPESWRVPVARSHDDYHYANVLISPDGRACGLDARRRLHRDPIYEDLATLLLDPVTRVATIMTGGLLLPKGFSSLARQSVLAGYFEGQAYDDAILDFYCAMALLYKWMFNERRLTSGAAKRMGVFLRPWVRWYFSTLLHNILSFPSFKPVKTETAT